MTEFQNSSISKENFSITNSGRNTLPLIQFTQPVQRQGSIMLDPRTNIPYYSDGISWIPFSTGTITNDCIHDADMTTSVCTDTDPPTGSETIYFTTDGTLRAIFDPDGVFIATAGAVDPTTIIPAAGKVAHFEGDIDVTGVVDPTGVQFTQQLVSPTATNVPNLGTLYVNSAPLGPFNNTLVFVDNADVSHTLGTMIGPAPFVTDNSITRFDGTSGSLIQESPLTLGDTGIIANPTGDIGLVPNGGLGTVNVTGDLSVTGIIEDPLGVQFTPQAVPPVGTNVIYIDTAPLGPLSNTLVFVDSASTAHTLGTMIGPGPLVTDNSITRFDGTTGNLVQESPLTLGDTGIIANPTGDIGLTPNGGAGTVNVTGDLSVTGIIEDPIGVQFTPQAVPPVGTNVIYIDTAPLGPLSNTLVFVDSASTAHTLGTMIGPGPLVTDNSITRFDGTTGNLVQESPLTLGDTGIIANPTGNIGLNPNGGTGTVNVTGNLNVMGTTTSIDTQTLLVQDNTIYLNNGYTAPMGLSGCVTVNYLPTVNSALVAGAGFTAGVAAVSNPTVVTDGSFAWSVGDIIQVSGANNVANDGLFEVNSYAAPILTIRGIGLVLTSFTFFQTQFTTDATVAGVITQVNVANICSGTNGNWEVSTAPSNDNTTGMTFVPLSFGPGDCVTVGTSADYPTIFDAYTAGNNNVCVITSVTETMAINLSSGPTHFCINLNPGVNVSNVIAGAMPWFTGASTLLKIRGAGAHMDQTTAGLSSQITLQAGQSLRSGIDAELDVEGVRFTGGVGTNILLSASSRISKCRFDGATLFDLSTFDRNLFVDNCLFTVPVQLDSTVGAPEKSAIISNNVFDTGANITIPAVNNLVFNGNTIGKNGATSMTISGATCDNVVISNNNFVFGELTISATNLTDTNISDNVWSRDTVDGLTISSICNNLIVSNNVLHHILLGAGTVTASIIDGNTTANNISSSASTTDTKITNNCIGLDLVMGVLSSAVISNNVIAGALSANTPIDSSITGNHFTTMTISGTTTDGVIDGNESSGAVTFAAFTTSTCIGNTFTGAVSFGALTTSTYSGNTSSAAVTFASLSASTLSGNVLSVAVTTISGTVSSSVISSNTLFALTISGAVSSSAIVGNTFTSAGASLTMSGSQTNVNFCSNTGTGTWGIGGAAAAIIDSNFNDNRRTGAGSLTFAGTFTDSNFNGNTMDLVTTFSLAVLNSTVSNNSLVTVTFPIAATVTNSNITGNVTTTLSILGPVSLSNLIGNIFSSAGAALTMSGSQTNVNFCSNTGGGTWVIGGAAAAMLDSKFNDNRRTGAGSLTFAGTFTDSNFNGNTMDLVTTFSLAVLNSTVSNNSLVTVTFPIAATVTNSNITGNVTTTLSILGPVSLSNLIGNIFSSAGAALTMSGSQTNVNFCSNTGGGTWVIGGAAAAMLDSKFNDNRRTGVGSLTFAGTFTDSNFNGNTMDLVTTFSLAVVNSTVSNNSLATLTISGAVSSSAIVGNIFTAALTMSGSQTNVNFCSNTGTGTWGIGGAAAAILDCNVNDNKRSGAGSLTFAGTFTDSNFNGNTMDLVTTFSLAVLNSNMSNNSLVTLTFPIAATVTNSNITGNIITTLTISSVCSRANIDNNTGGGSWNIADFSFGTFNNNTVTDGLAAGIVSFGGIFADSIMDGNTVNLAITITGTVTNSNISTNTCDAMVFSNTISLSNITGNNLTRDSGDSLSIVLTCNQVNITGNTTNRPVNIQANFTNGVLSNNQIDGSVTFGGTFANSTMDGNTVLSDITITLAVTNSNISTNKCTNMVFSNSITLSNITGNTMTVNAGNCLLIVLTCDQVNITGNTTNGLINIQANFTNGVFSNNRIDGSVTFGGTFADSTMVGNTVFTDITISGAVTDSNISTNICTFMLFSNAISSSNITENTMTSVVALFSLSIGGNCDRVNISGNIMRQPFVVAIGINFSDGVFNSNRIGGMVTFGGSFLESTMVGNNVNSAITITENVISSTITSNRIETFISINPGNNVISTNNSITGNTCGTTMNIGAAAGGISGNIINANVVPTSITVVSTGLSNIATSNRSSAIVGFMVGDVVANNV